MNKLSKLTLLCAAFAGMMACSDGKSRKAITASSLFRRKFPWSMEALLC